MVFIFIVIPRSLLRGYLLRRKVLKLRGFGFGYVPGLPAWIAGGFISWFGIYNAAP